MLGYIALVFALMIAINKFIKMFVWQEADTHIINFVMAKFGLKHSIDFHVSLYLCSDGFGWLGWDIFTRLLENLSLPLYVMAHLISLVALAIALVQQHSRVADKDSPAKPKDGHIYSNRPELAFHTVLCVFLGAMAVTTLRMKFLWTPYVCLLASVCVSDYTAYKWLCTRFLKTTEVKVEVLRHSITVAVLAIVVYKAMPPVLEQLKDLQEFYDPDTVDLMQWINRKTPSGAAFAGSMQLLAGVKLCTGRPITNHPHYEDKALRERTIELYQFYGRQSAENVHAVLQKYQASYFIMEDSICLAPAKDDCRLTDLVEAHYSQKSNGTKVTTDDKGLDQTQIPRFCDEVRHLKPDYGKYFQLVFKNRTFRVYKVL
ncbi:putative C-mannosyltransferase DPY19L3 [Lamellibrachia satsuma]|nr:putative C-mannosyltransferase DPY19L3 [Lamellibrachia satsuma]